MPSVRWGSLEFEHPNDPKPSPSLIRLDHGQGLQAWMNQSTLRNVLEAEGTSWIAAADYYRFPHVQYFHSVASLVQQLQSLSPATVATSMRRASQKIQSQTLAAYRQVLQHVLGFGHIYDSSDSSDSSCSFANILKVFCAYQWSYIEATFGPTDWIWLVCLQPEVPVSSLSWEGTGIRCSWAVPARMASSPRQTSLLPGTQVSDLEVS